MKVFYRICIAALWLSAALNLGRSFSLAAKGDGQGAADAGAIALLSATLAASWAENLR
jgi:hypothetical protein